MTATSLTPCCGHLCVCAVAEDVGMWIRYGSWLTQLTGCNPSWTNAEFIHNPFDPLFCSQQWLNIFSSYSEKLSFDLLYLHRVNSNGRNKLVLPPCRIILPASRKSPFNDTRHFIDVWRTVALILFPPRFILKQSTHFFSYTKKRKFSKKENICATFIMIIFIIKSIADFFAAGPWSIQSLLDIRIMLQRKHIQSMWFTWQHHTQKRENTTQII